MSNLTSFIKEARRRRVFRTGGIYIVAAWVSVQVSGELFQAFDIDDTLLRYVWIVATVGFPVALVMSWFYAITPEGVVRSQPVDGVEESELKLRPIDYAILIDVAIVTVARKAFFALRKMVPERGITPSHGSVVRARICLPADSR